MATFAVVVPLYVSPGGEDVFRFPKELLWRAEAIIGAAVLFVGIVKGAINLSDLRRDTATMLPIGAAVFVALITTLMSTNRALSISALGYFASGVVIFCMTYIAIGEQTVQHVVAIGTVSGVLNSVIAIVQRLNWWNPFEFTSNIPHRLRTTALIGNPNDVGAVLAVCTIVLIAFVSVRRGSPVAWIAAAALSIGVLASDSLTAILALTLGVLTLAWLMSARSGLAAIVILVACSVAGGTLMPSLRTRATTMMNAARARDYNVLTSYRLVAFDAAYAMFRDDPLTGVGPGTFKWQYLPYRLRAVAAHPELYLSGNENYGEVHSDHLQVLAEEGLIGYLAFLGSAAALGIRSLKRRSDDPSDDERSEYGRRAALPLTVVLLSLAATGFPLELPAVLTPLLCFTAAFVRWTA